MKPKERVKAAINSNIPDCVPRFEVWIDALYSELGVSNPLYAHPELGQDVVMLPSRKPEGSNAWGDGVDEFGRIWKKGMYTNGVVKNYHDLKRYTPSMEYALDFFDEKEAAKASSLFPDHFMFFGTHIGPFMSAYLAMGMQDMFRLLRRDLALVKVVLEKRTERCLAVFKRAVELGAELIVMGDDSAYNGGPLISPDLWRSLVLPCHKRLVKELPVPVVWHSDGKMDKLLPFAVEAGFTGIHGLEPLAGNKLSEIKKLYGDKLILIGNVDVNLLCESNLESVQADIKRCIREGGKRGFLLSTSNSIFTGMNPEAVREYFKYRP